MAAQLIWAIQALISSSCGGHMGRHLHVNEISTWAAMHMHMHTVKGQEGARCWVDKDSSRG